MPESYRNKLKHREALREWGLQCEADKATAREEIEKNKAP